MPSNIWTRCAGRSSLRRLSGRAWRVVESQHLFATRKLVDSDEEQALLEELIEDVKPPRARPAGLHYLLFTPFRYPPLRYGSRFGTRAELGIWYGSRTHATAFAEKAYYLLLFLEGTSAELTPLETDVSIFQAAYETRRGVDLTRGAFARYGALISSPSDYAASDAGAGDARGRGGGLRLHVRARSRARRQRRPLRARGPLVAPAQRAGELALPGHTRRGRGHERGRLPLRVVRVQAPPVRSRRPPARSRMMTRARVRALILAAAIAGLVYFSFGPEALALLVMGVLFGTVGVVLTRLGYSGAVDYDRRQARAARAEGLVTEIRFDERHGDQTYEYPAPSWDSVSARSSPR